MSNDKKRVVVTLEGNSRKIENAVHELKKFGKEACAEPELTATVQSETVEDSESAGFNKANE